MIVDLVDDGGCLFRIADPTTGETLAQIVAWEQTFYCADQGMRMKWDMIVYPRFHQRVNRRQLEEPKVEATVLPKKMLEHGP